MKPSRMEQLAVEARKLAERLGPILVELSSIVRDADLKAAQSQLQAVEKSVQSLESASVPVPEELLDRQRRLEHRLKGLGEAKQVLAEVARQLQAVPVAKTKASSQTAPSRRRTHRGGVSLRDLMEAGMLQDGAQVVHEKKRSGELFEGRLQQLGVIEVEVNGRTERFDSPSSAGNAVSGTNTNGWVYWSVVADDGSSVLLDEYRKRFLREKQND